MHSECGVLTFFTFFRQLDHELAGFRWAYALQSTPQMGSTRRVLILDGSGYRRSPSRRTPESNVDGSATCPTDRSLVQTRLRLIVSLISCARRQLLGN